MESFGANLKGKSVVISGASRGLGHALAIQFASVGCHVTTLCRSDVNFEPSTGDDTHNGISRLLCDVSDGKAVGEAIEQVVQQHGGVDVLFNNAALYPRVSFLEESAEDWAYAIGTNVNGVANGCKAVLPHMIKAGKGRIYNLGSWAYLSPIENSAAYSASKGAVHALTVGIAADLAPLDLDIQVHEWIPGHLNTRMSEYTGIDPFLSAKWALAMVSNDNASKKSTIFENDYEWVPPKRLKERLLDLVQFRS